MTTTINYLQVVFFLPRTHQQDLFGKQIQPLKRCNEEILNLNKLSLHDQILFTVRKKIVNDDIFFRH